MADDKTLGEDQSGTHIILEEAHLQIADMVQLQSLSSGGDVRYSVRLIGIARGRSVIVSTPMEEGKYLLMREGQTFVFRTFSGKSAFAFQTQLIKSANTPYPHLHLSYPKQVKSLVVRKGARASVRLVAAITRCEDQPIHVAATIINLSVGGAMLTSKSAPGVKGQHIVFKFKAKIGEIETWFELKAIIRMLQQELSGDTAEDVLYDIGLQFVDISPQQSIPLLAFVYNELLEQSQSH